MPVTGAGALKALGSVGAIVAVTVIAPGVKVAVPVLTTATSISTCSVELKLVPVKLTVVVFAVGVIVALLRLFVIKVDAWLVKASDMPVGTPVKVSLISVSCPLVSPPVLFEFCVFVRQQFPQPSVRSIVPLGLAEPLLVKIEAAPMLAGGVVVPERAPSDTLTPFATMLLITVRAAELDKM